MEQAVRKVEEFILDGSFHQLATANVDFLVNAATNPEYKEILFGCDLVLADGMPLIVASHLLGHALAERVTGSDLVPRLAALSRDKGYGIFLLGARPEVSQSAAVRLESMGARIVGRLSPPVRPLAELDDKEILTAIERANPDILLVAFGSPKQELWIDRNRYRLKVPVCIGIGAGLDFVSGEVPRAPRWMQRTCLEWLYRLCLEPRRLAPRYLKDALCLARYFGVQLAFNFSKPPCEREMHTEIVPFGSTTVLVVSGTMTGPQLARFERAALSATDRSELLVLDMEQVEGLGADGIRVLARLYGTARKRNCRFQLVGLGPALVRNLRASRCEELAGLSGTRAGRLLQSWPQPRSERRRQFA